MGKKSGLELEDVSIDSVNRTRRTVRIVVRNSQDGITRISLLVRNALGLLKSCGGDSVDALVGQKVFIQQKKAGFNGITHIGKDQDSLVPVIN